MVWQEKREQELWRAPISRMVCARCGKVHSPQNAPPNDGCGGRIEIFYDLDAVRETHPNLKAFIGRNPIEKYSTLLPLKTPEKAISLGEGRTPVIKAVHLAQQLGISELYLKLEMLNPSGSFKDRPISIGVSRAVEDQSSALSAASSGNAATSLATYGARANKRVIVFVPVHAPQEKVHHLLFLGATVFRVTGFEEGGDPSVDLFELACKEFGWTPCPSFGRYNCFQFEGTKTLGFELVEQLDIENIDWILFPTGSGGLLGGTMKGLYEFQQLGYIEQVPKAVAVQPMACAPVVHAIKNGIDPLDIQTWPSIPQTVAGGLADPFPHDGDAVLHYVRKSEGTGIAVSEDAILSAQRTLARVEGIFGEPTGVVGLAGLEMMIDEGLVDPSDRVIIPITGSGLKDLSRIMKSQHDAPVVKPILDELRSAMTVLND